MGKTSSAAVARYKRKVYDQITVYARKGTRGVIKHYAALRGTSINQYIVSAVERAMADDAAQYGEYSPPAPADE